MKRLYALTLILLVLGVLAGVQEEAGRHAGTGAEPVPRRRDPNHPRAGDDRSAAAAPAGHSAGTGRDGQPGSDGGSRH